MYEKKKLDKIEEAIRPILDEFEIDKDSEMYKNTPRRMTRMYLEVFSGLDKRNEPRLTLFDNPGY